MNLNNREEINNLNLAESAVKSFFELFPLNNQKWKTLLTTYYTSPNYQILEKLSTRLAPQKSRLVPNPERVFAALELCDPDKIKVVIVGQDPYPNPEHACGLAFGTADGTIPASLRNIFKEIQADCGGDLRTNGNLNDWAQQGVLLLNTSLTAEIGSPGIHSKLGWQHVTQFILQTVWTQSPGSIFLLWGKHAHEAFDLPQSSDDRIFKSGHPSPLAYGKKTANNFKGCQHFKKANIQLCKKGQLPIVWSTPDELSQFLLK